MIKNIYSLIIFVLITLSTFAQSPEKLSYQAIIRDAGSNLVTNTAIGIQISILQGTDTGTAVYTETQTPTTNVNGLATLEIGAGTTSEDFSTIDWSAGPYFIKTETDPTGGTSYTITGTSQLLSVPYALYAKTSGSGNYAGTSTTNLNWSQLESNCGFSVFGCNGSSIATFTTNESLSYTAGTRVRVTSASDINTFLEGIVQSYSSLVMSVLIDQITFNSGPTNDWVINLGSGGIGVPGMKGDNGQTASECFNYTFDSSTSASPFAGALRFNSTDLSTATQIYIHNNDTNAINQLDYYNLISNISSTIKGTIMVSKDSDTSMWSIFAINNITDNVGYQTLDVSYLSGATTPFNDFDDIAVCFGRTGDKGDSGTVDGKNILGSTGVTDPNVDVSNPNEGDQWINNDTGESFIYQNGVWNAAPSSFQLTDNADDTSTTSFEGTSTNLINPPATDGIFVWNQDGANGLWIPSSLDNSKNFIGTTPAAIEGGTAIVSGMDRNPIEGDEWSSSINGETFIFQNGFWNAVPLSSGLTSIVQTTDATATTITALSTSSDTLYYVESKILAKRIDIPGEVASFKISSTFLNNAGVLTLIGTSKELSDNVSGFWDVNLFVNGTDIQLRCTGEPAKSIDWKAVTEIIEN